jgi:hypothetical protein
MQAQEYQHMIDLQTIYECFAMMVRSSDPLLRSDEDFHLKDTRDNLACWVAMY